MGLGDCHRARQAISSVGVPGTKFSQLRSKRPSATITMSKWAWSSAESSGSGSKATSRLSRARSSRIRLNRKSRSFEAVVRLQGWGVTGGSLMSVLGRSKISCIRPSLRSVCGGRHCRRQDADRSY